MQLRDECLSPPPDFKFPGGRDTAHMVTPALNEIPIKKEAPDVYLLNGRLNNFILLVYIPHPLLPALPQGVRSYMVRPQWVFSSSRDASTLTACVYSLQRH